VRNPRRSRLSLQERELESKDNIFIIHPNSNHNYEKFIVGLYQVESGQVLGHLVSGHFGFRVVSGRVGLGIGSFSIGSFRVSGHIRSGRVGYRIVSDQVRSDRVSDRSVSSYFRF
jgi:hypothetical protein